jgi:hypothetical protein
MANRVVIFPIGKEAEAEAYKTWTNAHSPFAPNDFAYIRDDTFGQRVVPYLGPPFTWNGVEFAEPAGGEAARADGVLAESVTWPEEE